MAAYWAPKTGRKSLESVGRSTPHHEYGALTAFCAPRGVVGRGPAGKKKAKLFEAGMLLIFDAAGRQVRAGAENGFPLFKALCSTQSSKP